MARTKTTMQIHGISFKFIPFIITMIVFLLFSQYSPDVIQLPDAEVLLVALAFFIGGLAFVYEGVYAWPKKTGNQASMVGAIFFWIAGTGSSILGLMAWLGNTNPLTSGDFVDIAQIILIADMIMLFVGTIFEIVFSHRLSHKMAGKPPQKILN